MASQADGKDLDIARVRSVIGQLAGSVVFVSSLASWSGESLAARNAGWPSRIGLAALAVAAHGAVGYLALERGGGLASIG